MTGSILLAEVVAGRSRTRLRQRLDADILRLVRQVSQRIIENSVETEALHLSGWQRVTLSEDGTLLRSPVALQDMYLP